MKRILIQISGWLPATILVFGLAASVTGVSWPIASAICWGIATAIGFYASVSNAANEKMLRGKIDTAIAEIIKGHPSRNTAAAIFGQGELATKSYGDLQAMLERDYHQLR